MMVNPRLLVTIIEVEVFFLLVFCLSWRVLVGAFVVYLADFIRYMVHEADNRTRNNKDGPSSGA